MNGDGRYIDSRLGTLAGEGSQQQVDRGEERIAQLQPHPWEHVPTVSQTDPTYYDRPLLKPSVWKADIPTYYFLGGAAGAALALGAAAQLLGDNELQDFGQRCHWIGIIGSTIGGFLLIHDLGRPERFLNMMRVFRPTSPMNMGVWILSGAAPTAIAAGLFSNRKGLLGALGSSAGYASGVFGLLLAGYTGVLVGNTAIPVYYKGRQILPVLFLSSGVASAASILDLIFDDPRASRITLFYGTAGRVAELASGYLFEKTTESISQVARPLHRGVSGFLWRTAEVLTTASLVISLMPGQSPKRRKIAGVLGVAGSLALRFAVHHAGNASARDPRATFRLQRAGMENSA